jgi:hypothetical protein
MLYDARNGRVLGAQALGEAGVAIAAAFFRSPRWSQPLSQKDRTLWFLELHGKALME